MAITNSVTINYSVDTDTLTTCSRISDNFYCTRYDKVLPLSRILYLYESSEQTNLLNFKYINPSSYISGTLLRNSWEEQDDLPEFIDLTASDSPDEYNNEYSNNFIIRGSYVNFGRLLTRVAQVPTTSSSDFINQCEVYVSNNKLYIDKYKTNHILSSSNSFTANNFEDGVLPRRLIIVLSAAGGGGGAAGSGTSANGGGGGSGGFFACVLNTEWLWIENTGRHRKYVINIGKGGAGGWATYSQNTGWIRAAGSSGGDSSIVRYEGDNSSTLLCAKGGGGGGTWDNVAGTRGIVVDSNGTNLSDGASINGLGTYFWWLPYSKGRRSFEHGNDGGKGKPGAIDRIWSNRYYIYNTLNSDLQAAALNYMPVGLYASGRVSNIDAGGGGAASYFGNGGDGGGWTSDTPGKDASGYGAGGGGATCLFPTTGGSGGHGSNGILYIYAYGED